MADTLRIKRRSSGNPGAPTQLAYAELAFNEVDNILYYGRGNNAGQAVTIIPIAGPGFVPTAAGDVVGPSSATDNAVARFDTTTGKLIQNSIMTLADDGTLTIAISGQTTFQYDPNTNNGTVILGAKPPHGQLLKFCARSDITGSARFFGAANYDFDAMVSVPADPTSDLQLATKRYVDGKVGAGGTSITVSDTPPASPTDNSLWFESDTGALWLRYNDGNSTQWITISVPPGPTMGFLPLSGGTVTGDLTITPAATHAALILNKPVTAGTANIIWGQRNSVTRWNIDLGNANAESGSNVGSDFAINRWSDTGVFLGASLSIVRSNGNVFTGGFLGVNGGTGSVDVAMAVQHTHTGTPTYFWEIGTVEFKDSRAMAAGVGGAIVLSGKYDTAGNYAAMAGIRANKVNATSGDAAAGLDVWSRYGPINFYAGSSGAISTYNVMFQTNGTLSLANGALLNWGFGTYPLIAADQTNMSFQLAISTGYYLWYNREGSVVGKCYGYDGKWYNISAAWTALSDRSTKENIQPYPRGLKEIMELQPIYFTYKPGIDSVEGALHFGLIAQEVEPHFPELVGETDIEMAGEQQMVATLEPSNLIYACINAIKELSAEITALKQQIGAR